MLIKIAIGIFGLSTLLMGQSGIITGRVTDASGNAIVGAKVAARLVSAAPAGTKVSGNIPAFMPVPAKAVSAQNGQFEIDALIAGSYAICVDSPAAELLNPCLWSDTQTTTEVAGSGVSSSVSITVPKGVSILVRVQDTKGLVAANPAADDIMVGTVRGKSLPILARTVERDGMGKTMALVVPAGLAANLFAYSGAFSLADQSGKPLATATASIPITAPLISPTATFSNLQQAPPNLTIQISGKSAAAPVTVAPVAPGVKQ